MSNCHDRQSLMCQIDRLLNIYKSSVERLSRSKNLSGGRLSRPELSPISGHRGGRSSAVPGGRLSRPPRSKRAASNGKAVRAGAAWRWRSALCAGRGRHAAPDRTALPSGGGRWVGGAAAGHSGRAETRTRRPARTGELRGGSGTGGHQRQTRRLVVLFHVEQLYTIPCCRGMFYNIKSKKSDTDFWGLEFQNSKRGVMCWPIGRYEGFGWKNGTRVTTRVSRKGHEEGGFAA